MNKIICALKVVKDCTYMFQCVYKIYIIHVYIYSVCRHYGHVCVVEYYMAKGTMHVFLSRLNQKGPSDNYRPLHRSHPL